MKTCDGCHQPLGYLCMSHRGGSYCINCWLEIRIREIIKESVPKLRITINSENLTTSLENPIET